MAAFRPRTVLALALACGALLIAVPAAGAAGVYPTWTLDTSAGTGKETGTVTFGVLGAPNATYTSSYTGCAAPLVPEDDCQLELKSDEVIGVESPWGRVFGASTGKDFLRISHDSNAATLTRTTVYTFATPMPASAFGLLLGELDFETATVAATSDGTTALTGAQIAGAVTTPRMNYETPIADETAWAACLTDADGLRLTTGATSADVVSDSNNCNDGASVWLQPSAAVKTLTIVSHRTSGGSGSSFYNWMAVMARALGGKVTEGSTAGAPIAGATVTLVDAEGRTLGTATTGADGAYAFPLVYARAGYAVSVAAPSGYTAGALSTATADLSTADATANLVVTPVKPTLALSFATRSVVSGSTAALDVTYRNAAGSIGKATIALTLPKGTAFASSKCAKRSKGGATIAVKDVTAKAATCRIFVTATGAKRRTVTVRGTLTADAARTAVVRDSAALVIRPRPKPAPEPVTG